MEQHQTIVAQCLSAGLFSGLEKAKPTSVVGQCQAAAGGVSIQ